MKRIVSIVAMGLLWAMAAAPCAAQALTKNTNPFGITQLTPPYLKLNPGPQYWARSRIWQGVPGMERTASGRLWATWYAGLLGEGKGGNYAVLVTSTDDGKTWSKPVAVYHPQANYLDGDVDNAHLWIDPNGKMWWFFGRVMQHAPGDSIRTGWGFYTDEPDSPHPTWKGPVFTGWGLSLNKPLVLSSGEWLFGVDWLYESKNAPPPKPHMAKGPHFYKFAGYDKPFEHWGHATIGDSIFAEHMAIERKDGSLWMLVRTRYGMAQAISTDKGRTWKELEPFTRSFNVNVRFFFRRLASGNLLLVVCDDPKARARLTAMLSEDEGRTWPYKLLLDERNPVGYPDGVQAPDGSIYITYDHGRYFKGKQELLLAKFTEADIRAGAVKSAGGFTQRVINRLADEGGGVRYDGETWDLRKEWEKSLEDAAKESVKLLDGEKAEQAALTPATRPVAATLPAASQAILDADFALPVDQPAVKIDAAAMLKNGDSNPNFGKPQPRFLAKHEEFLAARAKPMDVLFIGDSITEAWRTTGAAVWKRAFADRWAAANFGISGDRTQHVLWRIANGELDGINPKAVVLLIGTNNTAHNSPEQIAAGVTQIVRQIRAKLPNTKLLLLNVLPRSANPVSKNGQPDTRRQIVTAVNGIIEKLHDGQSVHYLKLWDVFLDESGRIPAELMPDGLHPSEKGYEKMADAIVPALERVLAGK